MVGVGVLALSWSYHDITPFDHRSAVGDYPTAYNSLFTGAGSCVQCHGHDTAMIASVDILGNDVNVVDAWSSTMMANSAKDPFWRAKVSHEVLVNPGLQTAIEDKCTSCHAPLGHFAAKHDGALNYSIAEMLVDSLALDGVSCVACHQQDSVNLGDQFSGHLSYDTNRVAYGQYVSPLVSPMALASDYIPQHSLHIEKSEVCATCHTLITAAVDLEGNLTGTDFVEQATYHEWLNSQYAEDNQNCQSCHMPVAAKSEVKLAAGFDTPARSPFYLHEFAGANAFMLSVLKDNASELDVFASDESFDKTMAATLDMLQNKSCDISTELDYRTADTLYFDVALNNLAGHKFPSGYPSRRAVLEVVLTDQFGDTLFHSGGYNEEFETLNEDMPFEPHYDVINSEEKVQIYEIVMGNVNGEFTTVLDQAYEPLKDNRLVPNGFSFDHYSYDTTAVVGSAQVDPNFANDGPINDVVRFAVALEGYNGLVHVDAKLWYQSLPPRWMEEIFGESTPEIDAFEVMYDNADKSPILIDSDDFDAEPSVDLEELHENLFAFNLLNSVSCNGLILGEASQSGTIRVFSLTGSLIDKRTIQAGMVELKINTPGYVLIDFENSDGQHVTHKALILKN